MVTPVSDATDEMGIRQIRPNLGQGKDVYIFYTKGDRADYPASPSTAVLTTMENAEAQYLKFTRWRFGNINATSRELRFDTRQQTRFGDANLYSFDWASFKNGQAYLTFIQNNRMLFALFNGATLPASFDTLSKGTSVFEQSNATYPHASATALAYTTKPVPSSTSPSEGRTLIAWHENNRVYTRPFYNIIDLQVSYFGQEWGKVLKPDGEAPPLVKNNFSRPGDGRPVSIYINREEGSELVTVGIYTPDGRLVRQIMKNKAFNTFRQPVEWDKKTASGNLVASGVYYVLVETDKGFKKYHPIVIVR